MDICKGCSELSKASAARSVLVSTPDTAKVGGNLCFYCCKNLEPKEWKCNAKYSVNSCRTPPLPQGREGAWD